MAPGATLHPVKVGTVTESLTNYAHRIELQSGVHCAPPLCRPAQHRGTFPCGTRLVQRFGNAARSVMLC